MTLLEFIETSAERLSQADVHFGHGTTNARDEAAWLVLWSLGLPLDAELDAAAAQESRCASSTSFFSSLSRKHEDSSKSKMTSDKSPAPWCRDAMRCSMMA